MKTTMLQEAEAEIRKLLTRMHELNAGDLRGVETSMFALGRKTLECLIQCQRLVGMRPKQVLTPLGPITIQRAYDHCLVAEGEAKQEEASSCPRGEAPAEFIGKYTCQ